MFESRRRANTERRNAQIATLIFALAAILMFFLGVAASSLVFYSVAFVLLVIAGLVFAGGAGTWGIGATGEERVARFLNFLGNDYRVIHDVVLLGMSDNIDHVVLGLNSAFVVETKNHRGFITCNGDSWVQRKVGRRGTPYLGRIGCPSKQVKRYAILLRNLIQDRLAMDLYVNCLVVFTNRDAILHIDNPTVDVLRPDELCATIKRHSSGVILTSSELQKLEALIRPHSQYHN